MEIVSQLTDDQLALIGCAVALLATGTMMSLSSYLSPARRAGRAESPSAKENPLLPPQTSERKAA